MTRHVHRARLLAAVLVACSCAATVHAETAAPSPFAKVPPLPTACYSAGETFFTKLEAAQAAVAADRERQAAINQQIADRQNNMDPMEMAAIMQQWMMDNPQEAMAYMQGIQTATTDEPARIAADQQQEAKFETDRKALIANYHSAMKKLNAPTDARFDALNKRMVAEHGCGWAVSECGAPQWAQDEYFAIQRQRDAAHAAACPGWWGPTGQVTAFMKRYKDWLTGTHIPYLVSLEVHRTNQYAMFNTPAASYRSLEPYDSAKEYMNAAFYFYQLRREKPRCDAQGCEYTPTDGSQ